jgi:hypothetical protein
MGWCLSNQAYEKLYSYYDLLTTARQLVDVTAKLEIKHLLLKPEVMEVARLCENSS